MSQRTLGTIMNTQITCEQESVILSLAQRVETRDPFGPGHCERVSRNAVRFGRMVGVSGEDLEALRVGGLVHDIGKIGVPDSILYKPGPLDPYETWIVKQHTTMGERICTPLKSLRRVLPMIRHHHERMNGSGYPDGLQGEDIPLTVRVLQIVDICDALTSNRSYRRNLSLESAVGVLREEARRGWLDVALVNRFITFVSGSEVSLDFENHGGITEWDSVAVS